MLNSKGIQIKVFKKTSIPQFHNIVLNKRQLHHNYSE